MKRFRKFKLEVFEGQVVTSIRYWAKDDKRFKEMKKRANLYEKYLNHIIKQNLNLFDKPSDILNSSNHAIVDTIANLWQLIDNGKVDFDYTRIGRIQSYDDLTRGLASTRTVIVYDIEDDEKELIRFSKHTNRYYWI